MSIEFNPVAKKNWFVRHKILTIVGAVILLAIIGAIAGGGKGSPTKASSTPAGSATTDVAPVPEKTEAPPKVEDKGIRGGQYKVGTDLPAGEYVIVGSGYLQISSDSTGSFESIIENDNYVNRTVILVQDGQYVKFVGKAYTWEDAPPLDTSGGIVPEGKYKVGVDFPAGEYKVTPKGSGYYAVAATASDDLSSLVTNENFETEQYLTVQDGQYVKLQRATLALG